MEPIKKVPFTKEMKSTHTILIPTMLPIHFKILGNVLENYGYHIKILDNCGPQVIEQGLKNVHNDTCYPAQLVIGQMIDALEHCELPLDKVALLITQTGGGCRASNYIYLLRKALNKCGYGDIPVISASFIKSEQSGGFSLPLTMLLQALYGVLCGDLIMTLYNQCIPYEKQQGASQQAVEESILWAEKLFCKKLLRWKEVSELMVRIIKRFDRVERSDEEKIKVGVVGEIYVKYSPLGNNSLEQFLLSEGAEPVVPGLTDFIIFKIYNRVVDVDIYGGSALKRAVCKFFMGYIQKCQHDMIDALKASGRFRAPGDFADLQRLVKGYLGDGCKMGEGWLLTAEMLELIHSGTNNIVCAQPFGCLPNHIVGKGMIRVLKDNYPNSNVVAIDYDPSATEINQENRIKLMLANAKGLAAKVQAGGAPAAPAEQTASPV